MLNITVGRCSFEGRETGVQCMVVDPITGAERNLFGMMKGKEGYQSLNGFTLDQVGHSLARPNIKSKIGGYWTTFRVDVECEFLLKLVMNSSIRLNRRRAAMYFIARPKCEIGLLSVTKVPKLENGLFVNTTIQCLSGGFELIQMEDAEEKYDIKVNSIYRMDSMPRSYEYFIDHTVIREAVVKPPEIVENTITLGDGTKAVSRRRLSGGARSTRRIITMD